MKPAWEVGLRQSETFLCFITPGYLTSTECWKQVALAKRLRKPCIALIKLGTRLPEGFLDGFAALDIYYWRGPEDLARIADELRPRLGGADIIDGGVC